MGGKVEFVSTGSAPISAEVLDFVKITFGCDVLEGRLEKLFICEYETDFSHHRVWFTFFETTAAALMFLIGTE